MAFKMKGGVNHGEGTGSAFQKNWLTNFVSRINPRNRQLNPAIKNAFSNPKNANPKKTTVIKTKPVQTVSRKEYIPQSQRKSGNTGISFSQAYANKEDDKKFMKKYPTEKSFTDDAKKWNKANVNKEYDPSTRNKKTKKYIPQSQRK